MPRECGDCRVCCTAAEVVEFNKPSGVTCKHVCKGGCAIYELRPQACAVFTCSYLGGTLPVDERFRPDQLGIMFETMHLVRPDGSKLFIVIGLADTEAKAFEVAESLADSVQSNTVVAIAHREGGQVVVGTDEDADYYQAWLAFVSQRGSVDVQCADCQKSIGIG